VRIFDLIKEKLIGLGFVLDDKTVELNKTDFYAYNKHIGLFIFLTFYSFQIFINQFSNEEITNFIESLFWI